MGVICTNLANELGHHLVLPATVAGAAASVTSLLLKVSSDPAEMVSFSTIWCTWSKDVDCGLVMNYITIWLFNIAA